MNQPEDPESAEEMEPITPYGLMFGPPVPCTLGEIDEAFQKISDNSLLQIAGLGTVLGTGFSMAFGRFDMRAKAVAVTAFGPIASELDRRELQFPFEHDAILDSFFDWARNLNDENSDVVIVPDYRFALMSSSVQEALAWIGPHGAPEVLAGLQTVDEFVHRLLLSRRIDPPRFPMEVMNSTIRALSPGMSAHVPVELFIAYSHKDQRFRERLHAHISPLERLGTIRSWFDRKILPGQNWEDEIDQHLESADVILLLISSDFINSDYCYATEMNRALERHRLHEAIVIPILIRATHYSGQLFAALQMLPSNAKPVADWRRSDNAWVDVISGIEGAIASLRS